MAPLARTLRRLITPRDRVRVRVTDEAVWRARRERAGVLLFIYFYFSPVINAFSFPFSSHPQGRPIPLSTTVSALGAIASLSRALPLFADSFARHHGLEDVMGLFFYLQERCEGDVFVRLRVLECLREV
jgi:hypothetical protein